MLEGMLPEWWSAAEPGQQMDNLIAAALLSSMGVSALVLLSGVQAPYGRYSTSSWGPRMNGKLAWILQVRLRAACRRVGRARHCVWTARASPAAHLRPVPVRHGRPSGHARARGCMQELPSFAVPASMLASAYPRAPSSSLANLALLAAFCTHYFNRTFIFPLRIRGGKPTPVSVFLMAFGFCVTNGWLQGRALTVWQTYDAAWTSDPRFLGGLALFALGMAINIHADTILMNLRKPGETGYKIPRGGMFELVSGANFLGECLEWSGFAIACWCARRRGARRPARRPPRSPPSATASGGGY